MEHETKGTHIILDLYKCNPKLLNNKKHIEEALNESCKLSNCKVLKKLIYQFKPQGITGILLLEESHISIHTYPEHNSCFADIYTCGDDATPEMAIRFLEEFFQSEKIEITTLTRGQNGNRN